SSAIIAEAYCVVNAVCDIMAPLGAEVVPDVYCNCIRSEPSTSMFTHSVLVSSAVSRTERAACEVVGNIGQTRCDPSDPPHPGTSSSTASISGSATTNDASASLRIYPSSSPFNE